LLNIAHVRNCIWMYIIVVWQVQYFKSDHYLQSYGL